MQRYVLTSTHIKVEDKSSESLRYPTEETAHRGGGIRDHRAEIKSGADGIIRATGAHLVFFLFPQIL